MLAPAAEAEASVGLNLSAGSSRVVLQHARSLSLHFAKISWLSTARER